MVWVLKHGHIGDAFFDVDAAQFLLDELVKKSSKGREDHREKGNCEAHSQPAGQVSVGQDQQDRDAVSSSECIGRNELQC